jgi:uncharacterized protein (TIGR04255 family)
MSLMAGKFPHLSKAPIYEAVVAVKFGESQRPLQEELDRFCDFAVSKFKAEKETIINHEIIFDLQDNKTNLVRKEMFAGRKLTFEEGQYVLQCTSTSLSLSRLKKYQDGDSFIKCYEVFWNEYCKFLMPERIKRIGMRYINKFSFTADDYYNLVKITPGMELPGLALQDIKSVHKVFSPTLNSQAIIRTNENAEANNSKEIIINNTLDIDVYRESDLLISTFAEVNDVLAQLRELKNHIFFSNLHQKGVEFFV